MRIVEKGSYIVEEKIFEVEFDGKKIEYFMMQIWLVCVLCLIMEKYFVNQFFLVGQCVFDVFFFLVQGGIVVIFGVFGCGKIVIFQFVFKFFNSDVIVYVGCGECGNEMVEVLKDFLLFKIEVDGCMEFIMKCIIFIVNMFNMFVVVCEVFIYIGIIVVEYFRDQGMDVVMMVDLFFCWVEVLREIFGCFGEMFVD